MADDEVTSSQYIISEKFSYVGRILPRTSIEKFKAGFNIPSQEIQVYQDATLEDEVTSGYVATGMMVTFNGINQPFEISVVGDFNGDGLANQLEIQYLLKHILGMEDYSLEGIKFLCADINNDLTVDQIDLTKLIHYVVYGRLSIEGYTGPQKPTIEILSGNKDENNSYTSDVVVKITQNEAIEKAKTVYTISGATTIPETEIPENGQITLQGTGLYLIKSYTYFMNGIVSETTELLINKTGQEISETNMGISFQLDHKGGEPYIPDTWTNSSVYIETTDTTEKINDLEITTTTTYTIAGPKTIENATSEPVTLEETGTYVVTATSTDTIGRTKTKQYNVKIDKQNPVASTITIEGNPEANGYYKADVNVTMKYGSDHESGFEKATYQLIGAQEKEVADLPNDNEMLTITAEGTTTIKILTYDKVGNVSETTQEVKLDKSAPTNITIQPSHVTSAGFQITATAEDTISGIKEYAFYVDGALYKVVTTGESSATIDVETKETENHEVKVEVTDNTGNKGEQTTTVANARIADTEVDHIEFEITNYAVTNKSNPVGEEDVTKVISISGEENETSSRYIQITVNRGNNADTLVELEGIIRVVRKDGGTTTDMAFFPENLTLELAYESSGTGMNWKHQTQVEICGEKLCEKEEEEITEDIPTVSKTFTINELQQSGRNYFKITEHKLAGVSSQTRFTIQRVLLGDKMAVFKIIDKTAETKE